MRDEDVRQIVDAQLRRAVPDGWVVNLRPQGRWIDVPADDLGVSDLEWKLAPEQHTGILEHDYLIRVSLDQRAVLFLYGNRDAGVHLPRVEMKAIVMLMAEDWEHLHGPHGRLDEHIVQYIGAPEVYPPNTWGFS